MTQFFSHPLVTPNLIEHREYQAELAEGSLKDNTLVILPTGLGKTSVALRVMVERLTGENKVVLVAPTKPLCEQHFKNFEKYLPYTAVRIITGEKPSAHRLAEWNDAQVIIGTPQTIENDLKSDVYTLKDVSLMIIDEAHRAVGAYSYNYLAKEYMASGSVPLILAMTASPGGEEEKVDAIKESLFIHRVLIKAEDDPDVAQYVHNKDIDRLWVDLPPELSSIRNGFRECLSTRIKATREMGIKCPTSPGIKDLNSIKAQANRMISEQDGTGYALSALHAEMMKIKHGALITETQGIVPLKKYLDKIQAECSGASPQKSSIRLMNDERFQSIIHQADDIQHEIHPKAKYLPNIVRNEVKKNPSGRILIFASYRDMVEHLVSSLIDMGISASQFVGQSSKDGRKGMNQKKQVETIEKFKSGEFQVLVSTCVGEEGLDVPSCDLVIFYEPVPSEIRSIQRRGRTGRFATGRVIIMITRGTSDETSYLISQRKEQTMRKMDHTTRQKKICGGLE